MKELNRNCYNPVNELEIRNWNILIHFPSSSSSPAVCEIIWGHNRAIKELSETDFLRVANFLFFISTRVNMCRVQV